MQSYIFYRKQWALIFFIHVLVIFGLIALTGFGVKSRVLALFFVFIMFLPALLFKFIVKTFRKVISIALDDQAIQITVTSERGAEEQNFVYPFPDLLSYNVQFPNRRFSCLRFYTGDGKSKEYSFLTEKIDPGQVGFSLIVESIQKKIAVYNAGVPIEAQIVFRPSFFATKGGLICIVLLSVLCTGAVVAHALIQTKTFPASLFVSILLIFQIVARRSADLTYSKKMDKATVIS